MFAQEKFALGSEALADIGAVLDDLALEWWPTCGTLIALMRYGKRSGQLSDGQLDVVDHDVDIMVGLNSEETWPSMKWKIWQKLSERGWKGCIGRYSVDAEEGSSELMLAREDLMLCKRQDPDITLDIATYIIEKGQNVYAQKFCAPVSLRSVLFLFPDFPKTQLGAGFSHPLCVRLGDTTGCYVPWDAGTFRFSHGRLRKKAIYPMRRCRAGHFSVPCPAKPVEALQASNIHIDIRPFKVDF